MIIFAFPGTGKTTLAKSSARAVDLELSEIKYDNSSVQHLTKEQRKAVRRPLASPDYKKDYAQQARHYHEKGYLVLVAINMLLSMLLAMRYWLYSDFHLFVPHWRLRQEYQKRYQERGNNCRFIFEVMLVWYPTTLFFQALSYMFPQKITIMQEGEYLQELIRKKGWLQ